MENVKDRDGRLLAWTQPYPDGIWRAGTARSGRWLMFHRSSRPGDRPPPCT